MCGIAGVSANDITAEHIVTKMLQLIRHRGPDADGKWSGREWCIGMARLAIIDPEHGQQPMASVSGRWMLVFNGEIYNCESLRPRLAGAIQTWRTRSDTEVLVEHIDVFGVIPTLRAVEGMFAFAAVDLAAGDIWLARDRFGEKPLFVDRREGGFVFCSELAPLLMAWRASKRISPEGVLSILRYGHPWPGLTAVQGIESLPPGTWLRRTAQGVESSGVYWRPPDRIDEEAGSLEKSGSRLLELLDTSVRDRLVSDVPLGLFLSGGIDSAAVAASAVQYQPDITAVTVGFDDAKGYDERPLARKTAAHLGLKLVEEQGTFLPFSRELFDEILWHHGQPFADTSAIPTRAVSRAARRRFTVVLSGDGGDELLAGYLAHSRNRWLSTAFGGSLGGSVADVIHRGMPSHGRLSRVKRTFELIGSVGRGLLPHTMAGVFDDSTLLDLVRGTSWESAALRHLDMAHQESRQLWDSVRDPNLALSLYQLRHSLPQDILTKVDRMSMAESLEVRAPFLDSKLATYALSLPPAMKISGKLGKYVLRRALATRLPSDVLVAPKRGFALPVRQWLGRTFWSELAHEVRAFESDHDGEFNLETLRQITTRDAKRCTTTNDYRALHRAVLIYSFLRWRRTLVMSSPASIRAHVA
jgi:asparagine synthase (glutamine-hydrolysing)